MDSIFRTINQFMPTYDPFAAGAQAVGSTFRMNAFPVSSENRFNQMMDAGEQRRMEEVLRMGGYGGSMSGSFGGSMGSTPWYLSSPMIQFPQGGMMQ
jgi:hypothetical protein